MKIKKFPKMIYHRVFKKKNNKKKKSSQLLTHLIHNTHITNHNTVHPKHTKHPNYATQVIQLSPHLTLLLQSSKSILIYEWNENTLKPLSNPLTSGKRQNPTLRHTYYHKKNISHRNKFECLWNNHTANPPLTFPPTLPFCQTMIKVFPTPSNPSITTSFFHLHQSNNTTSDEEMMMMMKDQGLFTHSSIFLIYFLLYYYSCYIKFIFKHKPIKNKTSIHKHFKTLLKQNKNYKNTELFLQLDSSCFTAEL